MPVAPSASMLIATRIGIARSAIAWTGPGKPTSVSSISPLAGFVGHLGVVHVACFELARLGDGLAVEGAEDHPEGVDGGEKRADVADGIQRPVPAAALAGHEQDVVLGEESGERRDPRQGEAADDEAAVGEGHRLLEAAHLLERLLAGHRPDQRAGGHEEQRLEEGVGHQVKEARRVGADGDAHDHVADLRHRRVGDHALDVRLGEADRAGDQERERADHGADVLGGGGAFEQRVHARDQVDAGGDHRRGVDQRADRRRALHRVGQPRVKRDLRRLGEGADQQQQAAGDQVAVVRGVPEGARDSTAWKTFR